MTLLTAIFAQPFFDSPESLRRSEAVVCDKMRRSRGSRGGGRGVGGVGRRLVVLDCKVVVVVEVEVAVALGLTGVVELVD